MTDVVVDRLRIRGAGAGRLATVAARTLPAALEEALADLTDGVLGPLRVTLDVADHDEATLALLWADAIRAAALAAGATTTAHGQRGRRGRPAEAPDAEEPPDGGAATGDAAVDLPTTPGRGDGTPEATAAVLAAWLDAGAPRHAVPVAVARLTDGPHAAAVVALLGPDRGARLAEALHRVAVGPEAAGTAAPAGADRTTTPTERAATGPPDAVVDEPSGPVPEAPPAPDVSATTASTVAALVPAADAVAPHVRLAAASGTGTTALDLGRATRAAGVVLCYPWLADLCRTSEALLPDLAATDAHRLVLATLAAGVAHGASGAMHAVPAGEDPEDCTLADPALLDDPLVLLLAGADDDALPGSAVTPVDDLGRIAAAADDVLVRFAALLRGFERSTPAFVRASWVARPGLVDTDLDPVRLVAERRPLDLVLDALAYPVTLLRLPWTPPITVRFAP